MKASQVLDSKNVYVEAFRHVQNEVHIWELVRNDAGKIISWKLVDANLSALKSWNKKLEEIRGKRTEEIFIDANPVEQFLPIVEKIFSTQLPHSWEQFFPGTNQILEMMSIPVGEFFISAGQDITKRKRREIERNDILTATGVGVWKYDLTKDALFWDENMFALYGRDKATFSGTFAAWVESVHPDYIDTVQQELRDAIDGIKSFEPTFAIITPKGEQKYIKAKANMERDSSGKAIFISGINLDKTFEVVAHQKIERERLKSLQASKLATLGELVAGIAHEINNPLSLISGCSSILQRKDLDPDQVNNNLQRIQKAVDRISKIVSGLKKFSRSGDELVQKRLNLVELVDECIDILSPKLNRHSVRIEKKISPDFQILGDEIQIEQVLINLVVNAVDAISGAKSPWVEVSASTDSDFDYLIVKDSGQGIDKSHQEQLFDPFFTTKGIGQGTGLGLSVSKGIAKDHGGDLEYKLLDGHTAFVLKLPKSLK